MAHNISCLSVFLEFAKVNLAGGGGVPLGDWRDSGILQDPNGQTLGKNGGSSHNGDGS